MLDMMPRMAYFAGIIHGDCMVSEVICVRCGRRWVAPDEPKLGEWACPYCARGYVIETGETKFAGEEIQNQQG